MQTMTYEAPDGRSFVSVTDSNPDPERRFSVKISEPFFGGPEVLRDLAKHLFAVADGADSIAAQKKADKAAKKPAAAPAPAATTTAKPADGK